MDLLGYTPDTFLKALGTFWTTVFEDQNFLKSIVTGTETNIANEYMRFCEMILGESVHDIPVFNRKNWVNLTFRQS